MLRRSVLALPAAAALFAAPPKLPSLSGRIRSFGLDWDVLDPADWSAEGSGAAEVLSLKKARPQEANPRCPIQYALAASPVPGRFTLELEVLPDKAERGLGSAIIVYAWRDNLHFNYVHLSPDYATKQPVHNGVFHVYGGDRVRISGEQGPPVFQTQTWTPVRIAYDPAKHEVETWISGEKHASLRGIDLSLGAGRIGLGSFFNTASFRRFRLTQAA